jgi:phosphate:Na+ symporter
MEKLMLWSIPKSEAENKVFSYARLDERFLNNTAYAVRVCKDVAIDMMSETKKGVNMALQGLREYSVKDFDEIVMLEEVVDQYEDKIGTYLIKLSSHSMYEGDSQTCSALLHCIGDFERMSDHSVGLITSVKEMVDKKLKFADRAHQEIIVYTDAIAAIVEQTFTAFKYFNLDIAMTIEPFEEVIDKLTAKVKKRHYKRLANGKCSVEMGYILQDILTNCERIADHCSNVAIGLLQMEDLEQVAHRYQENLSDSARKNFAETYQAYLKKYELPDK